MRSYDLIACGALNLDLIYRLSPDFPLWKDLGPPGGEQVADERLRRALDDALADVPPARSGGGQAANAACALARLGYRTAMVGRVGDDEHGASLIEQLDPADARFVARGGSTGRVYVLLDKDGERRSLVWPGANDDLRPSDLPRRLPATRYAHFTSFAGDGPSKRSLLCSRGCRPRWQCASTLGRSTLAKA